MKNKKLVIVDNNIEYTLNKKITHNGEHYRLKRSKNDKWVESEQGVTCLTALDTGCLLYIQIGDRTIDLDYSECLELQIVLQYMNETQATPSEFKIIQVKK
jgi:hypothetical protein